MRFGLMGSLLAGVSLASVVAVSAGALPALAQEQASLIGQVQRDAAGTPFANVDIRIASLGVETKSGADGRFRLAGVAPGTYSVEFSFLGEVLETREVTLAPGQESLSVNLAERVLDRIVITGTRGALANARALERGQDGLTSVVTSDDIGNFADQNVAESLQRLPGLTINRSEGEGQKVAVRGLSGSFVTVTLDGTRLASRRENEVPDDRSVALDTFSSDLLNGIEVSKTLTPDQDADAIAGSIDLKTLSAFQRGRDSLSLRGELGYQELSEDTNPKLSGDFTKIFDLESGGQIGIAGGLSWQNRKSLVNDFRGDDGLRATVPGVNGFIGQIYNTPALGFNPTVGFRDPGTCNSTVVAGTPTCITPPANVFSPRRIDIRADPAERTRLSGNLNIEYRPNEDLSVFLRASGSEFEDKDIRNRTRWELDDAENEEILALGADFGTFTDVDVERRIRFTDQVDTFTTAATGFDWTAGAWTISGQVDVSQSESDVPSLEARYRERDAIVSYSNLTIDSLDFEVLANPRQGSDPTRAANWEFRFLEQLDFFVEEDYGAAKLDFDREFTFNGAPATFSFGGKVWKRERSVDENRGTINAPAGPVLTLAGLPSADAPTGADARNFINVDLDATSQLVEQIAATGSVALEDDDVSFNLARDYTAEETIGSLYAMTKFQILPRLEFIGGVRVERTEFETQGFISDRLVFDDDVSTAILTQLRAAGVTDQAILASPLGSRYQLNGTTLSVVEDRIVITPQMASNEYTNIFPNLNLRWEPLDTVVVRASYTEGLQRPVYDQATVNAEFRTSERTEDTDIVGVTSINQALGLVRFERQFGTDLDPLRNPQLDPLTSRNYDLSVSWYPNDDTFLQVALFYKDIEDFIVRFSGNAGDLGQFGFTPQSPQDTVRAFVNGESAFVTGVELTYSQNYTFLPGVLSGLFASANITLADSEQSIANTITRVTRFQDQADLVGNASVGWENDKASLRVSANYVGERVLALNAAFLGIGFSSSDLLEQERLSVDVNARYDVSEGVQIYFDAININDANDRRFFEGGGVTGPVLAGVESYGPTYQVGVRARF